MKRILVTGAGGPAGVNFLKALRNAPEDLWLVAADASPYHLGWVPADRKYLVPRCSDSAYVRVLNEIISEERIDLVHPQPDVEVSAISESREHLKARTWLPAADTVRLLEDKYRTCRLWEDEGVRAGRTLRIACRRDLERAVESMGLPLWMRAARGAGALGSTPVYTLEAGLNWLAYWREREVGWQFIAQPYLPGADLAFESLWREGRLLTSLVLERVEYIFPHVAPSGRTGTPTVSVSVHREDVNRIAADAVRAVDRQATGIFSVDLREDPEGRPVPTEINCGRFFSMSLFFAEAGANLPYLYVKAALGEPLGDTAVHDAIPTGLVWLRHIDCPSMMLPEGDYVDLTGGEGGSFEQ